MCDSDSERPKLDTAVKDTLTKFESLVFYEYQKSMPACRKCSGPCRRGSRRES